MSKPQYFIPTSVLRSFTKRGLYATLKSAYDDYLEHTDDENPPKLMRMKDFTDKQWMQLAEMIDRWNDECVMQGLEAMPESMMEEAERMVFAFGKQ